MISIRGRLVFILTGLFVFVWLVVVAITYMVTRQRIETLFDARLERDAHVLLDLIQDADESQQIRSLAADLDIPNARKTLAFWIWQDGRLRMRSAAGPRTDFPARTGYADLPQNGKWRTFSFSDLDHNLVVQVGEPSAIRSRLALAITRDALFPLYLAVPILGIVIWFGVGRGLSPLQRTAEQIGDRSPHDLKPVDLSSAPREIHILVRKINSLLLLLREAFERERHFTADAAHEIRTPLAGIKAHAQLAQRTNDHSQRGYALQQILENVDRSAHLIDQLLTLARMDRATFDSQPANVDLSAAAAELVVELQPLAQSRSIQLSVAQHSSAMVLGSAPALRIMVRNLLVNALHHARSAVTVRVYRAADNSTLLDVEDDGPGIPESDRGRVFDRFYRGKGQTGAGCGLGLSIVQRIAALHSAEIVLSDSDMGGLCARVCFSALPCSARRQPRRQEVSIQAVSRSVQADLPPLPQK